MMQSRRLLVLSSKRRSRKVSSSVSSLLNTNYLRRWVQTPVEVTPFAELKEESSSLSQSSIDTEQSTSMPIHRSRIPLDLKGVSMQQRVHSMRESRAILAASNVRSTQKRNKRGRQKHFRYSDYNLNQHSSQTTKLIIELRKRGEVSGSVKTRNECLNQSWKIFDQWRQHHSDQVWTDEIFTMLQCSVTLATDKEEMLRALDLTKPLRNAVFAPLLEHRLHHAIQIDNNNDSNDEGPPSVDPFLRQALDIAVSLLLKGLPKVESFSLALSIGEEYIELCQQTGQSDMKTIWRIIRLFGESKVQSPQALSQMLGICLDNSVMSPVIGDTMPHVLCHLSAANAAARMLSRLHPSDQHTSISAFKECFENSIACLVKNHLKHIPESSVPVNNESDGDASGLPHPPTAPLSSAVRIPVHMLDVLMELLSRLGLVHQCLFVLSECDAQFKGSSHFNNSSSSVTSLPSDAAAITDQNNMQWLMDLPSFKQWFRGLTGSDSVFVGLVSRQMWVLFIRCLSKAKSQGSLDHLSAYYLSQQVCFRSKDTTADDHEDDENDAKESEMKGGLFSISDNKSRRWNDFDDLGNRFLDEMVKLNGDQNGNVNDTAHLLNLMSSGCHCGFGLSWFAPAAKMRGVLHPYDTAFSVMNASLRRRHKWAWQKQMTVMRRRNHLNSTQRSSQKNRNPMAATTDRSDWMMNDHNSRRHTAGLGWMNSKEGYHSSKMTNVMNSVSGIDGGKGVSDENGDESNQDGSSDSHSHDDGHFGLLTHVQLNGALRSGLSNLRGQPKRRQENYARWILYRFDKAGLRVNAVTARVLNEFELDVERFPNHFQIKER